MHIYNTSTQKAEAGDGKFKTNLGYIKRPSSKRREEQKRDSKNKEKRLLPPGMISLYTVLALFIIQNNYSVYKAIHTPCREPK